MRIGRQVQAQTPKPVDEDFVRGLLDAAGAPAGIRDTFTPAQAPAPAAQTAQDRPLSTREQQVANQRGGSPDAGLSAPAQAPAPAPAAPEGQMDTKGITFRDVLGNVPVVGAAISLGEAAFGGGDGLSVAQRQAQRAQQAQVARLGEAVTPGMELQYQQALMQGLQNQLPYDAQRSYEGQQSQARSQILAQTQLAKDQMAQSLSERGMSHSGQALRGEQALTRSGREMSANAAEQIMESQRRDQMEARRVAINTILQMLSQGAISAGQAESLALQRQQVEAQEQQALCDSIRGGTQAYTEMERAPDYQSPGASGYSEYSSYADQFPGDPTLDLRRALGR